MKVIEYIYLILERYYANLRGVGKNVSGYYSILVISLLFVFNILVLDCVAIKLHFITERFVGKTEVLTALFTSIVFVYTYIYKRKKMNELNSEVEIKKYSVYVKLFAFSYVCLTIFFLFLSIAYSPYRK
jgi:hypothetical protein